MKKRTCSLCDAPYYGRGWCRSHYDRWRSHGDPTHIPTRLTHEQRFWTKVRKTEGCWLWQGPSRNGYGLFACWDGTVSRATGAHRYSYQLARGPIPDDLVIDHLCRTPLCVNPDHLEPVSRGENVLRGIGSAARNLRKTHCVKGHEFTEENTRVNKRGHRACRACDREAANRRLAEKGRQPVSDSAKKALKRALVANPDASTKQLAAILGWSTGHTVRVKAEILGPADRSRKPCSVEDCDRLAVARKLCAKHYDRWKKHGDPLFERPPTPTHCSVDGCSNRHRARGLCSTHWMKLRKKERAAG